MAFTTDWDTDLASDTTNATQIDDYINNSRTDHEERLKNWIYGYVAGENDGVGGLIYGKFKVQATAPTQIANTILLYGLDVSAKCELHFIDEDGNAVQLTSGGNLIIGNSTAPQALLISTEKEDTDGGRESQVRAKGTQSGEELTTLGYLEFAHDGAADDQKGKFKLVLNDGDDGDVPSKIALEIHADGTIEPYVNATNGSVCVLDEDDMASDSAVKLATQQSIKAYAAAVIAQYVLLKDIKTAATAGGASDADTWTKRTVAEILDPDTLCAVTSSVIVLSAGDYFCRISAPAYRSDAHQIRLRNTTGSSTLLTGSNADLGGGNGMSNSHIVGKFTVAAAQNLEIQHNVETTRATDGFGAIADFTGVEEEVYTVAEFWKIG